MRVKRLPEVLALSDADLLAAVAPSEVLATMRPSLDLLGPG